MLTFLIKSPNSKANYLFNTLERKKYGKFKTGKGKSGVHGLIHAAFDKEEYRLGEAGNPKWTTKLGDLEDKAALSIAAKTGCDPVDLKRQLREYHQKKGLGEDKPLRADPYGKNTTSLTNFELDPIIKMRMPDHSW